MSSSFWWPWTFEASTKAFLPQYVFLNSTLANLEGQEMQPRLRQKVIIDVGAKEDFPIAQVKILLFPTCTRIPFLFVLR